MIELNLAESVMWTAFRVESTERVFSPCAPTPTVHPFRSFRERQPTRTPWTGSTIDASSGYQFSPRLRTRFSDGR